jgi:hypothetical protein
VPVRRQWGGLTFQEKVKNYETMLTHVTRNLTFPLKGQSHEKVGEMRVWGISLGPN